jgi:HAD superfamily hydrolase (TIGR01509 family)
VDDPRHVPTVVQRLEAFHRDNAHLIRPFDGVRALLDQLRDAGVQIAMWTGRDRVSADWLLREHQLTEYFATVVCGDDLPSHKPDPAGLREIMRRLGVTPAETLFVGDSDVDVLGGAACGVDTLLIQHRREVEMHIASKSWHTVTSAPEAFQVVLGCIAKIS